MNRKFPMFTHNNYQLSSEPRRDWDSNQPLSLVVRGQRTDWHKAYSHSERDQIDNQVKIIELHGRLNAPALAPHPRAQVLAGIGAFGDQQPVLFSQPLHSCFRLRERLNLRLQSRRRYQGERILKSVRHAKSLWEPLGRTEDADVLFMLLKCRKNLVAGLAGNSITYLRESPEVRMKKPRQVCEANGAGHIHTDLFAGAAEFLPKVMQRPLDVAEQSRRLAIQKLAGRRNAHCARCPLEELNPEAVFDPLYLPGNSALSQSGQFRCFRETSLFHDQLKERELIQVERHGLQKLMHMKH